MKIKDKLCEVRKAYRLIFDYQNRILDLVKFIETKFDLKGNTEYPLQGSKDSNLKDTSRSWLHPHYREFHFDLPSKSNPKDELSIFIFSDDGSFAPPENQEGKMPFRCGNPKTFQDVSISCSKIFLVYGKGDWASLKHGWIELLKFSKEECIINEDHIVEDKNGKGIKLLYKSYDLEQFEDHNKAICSIEKFKDCLKSKGIKIKFEENSK